MSNLWLIIWRFQPLHKGHLLLINKSIKENSHCLILIWSSNKNNACNPYKFDVRKKILEAELKWKDFTIWSLPDFPNDRDWLQCIIKQIPKEIKYVTLYCGDKKRDSAIQSIKNLENMLPFKLKIIEMSRSIIPVSATQVRRWIQEKNILQLKKYVGKKSLKEILQI